MSNTQKEETHPKTIKEKLSRVFSWNWIVKLLLLTAFSLVINHLSTRDNFPDSESYAFPFHGIIASIILGAIIGVMADYNFKFHKKKYFSKQVEVSTIARFVLSSLGYIILIYIPFYLLATYITNGQVQLYYFLIGLLLTLLICLIAMIIIYAKDVYDLYQASLKEGNITISHGAKTTKLTYEDIACFYSEEKVVYAVQHDVKTITTDFTLNELEAKINNQLFFRANRQIIIHINAVAQIEKIENGKLLVRLKSLIPNSEFSEITISRYKRKAFLDWFEKKT